MFTERRPIGLRIVVLLAILNSLATVIHFFLLNRGVLKVHGLTENLWVYAAAVTLAAVLPTAFGAYGLYYKRMWGLGLFIFGSGAYLCSSFLIMLLSLKAGSFGIMFYISLYIILFSLAAAVYSWIYRPHLSDF